MGKAGLRTRIRARRAASHTVSAGFVHRVLAAVPRGAVCCYVGLPGEPPTTGVIEALLDRGDPVYLPVSGAGGHLDWVPAEGSRPWDAWGVPGRPGCAARPVPLPQVTAVVVPALAVTPDGRRLGQGGGYYDRFLPGQPQARTVALVWADEVLDDLPTDPHDARLDAWVVADD